MFRSGNTVKSGTASGTVVDRDSFNMSYDMPNHTTGTVSMVYNSDLYERTSTLTKTSGMWGLGSTVFTIESNGTINGQDSSGCTYNGRISVVNALYNAYALSIDVRLWFGLSGLYTGTAYINDQDVAPSGEVITGTIYLHMNSDNNAMYRALHKL